jgi:nickel-dependent lactate racemase
MKVCPHLIVISDVTRNSKTRTITGTVHTVLQRQIIDVHLIIVTGHVVVSGGRNGGKLLGGNVVP